MKVQFICTRVFFLFVVLLISCNKHNENDNRSARLVLLQQTWTSRVTRLYYPNGDASQYYLDYFGNPTFTFAGDFRYYQSTTTNKMYYTLLPDDSTVIFTFPNISQPSQPIYDTNYISSISGNELIFSGLDYATGMNAHDTLRR